MACAEIIPTAAANTATSGPYICFQSGLRVGAHITLSEQELITFSACIAGLARMSYYPKFFADKDVFCMSKPLGHSLANPFDLLIDTGALLSLLANIECNVGIICGSLPEIRPLFMRLFHKRNPGSSDPGSYQPSNPMSGPSPRRKTFSAIGLDDLEAARLEKSDDSLNQMRDWDLGKSPHHIVTETVYLKSLSPPNMTTKHGHRTSGSGTDVSRGSDENWVSGGEVYGHPKNIPSSAL